MVVVARVQFVRRDLFVARNGTRFKHRTGLQCRVGSTTLGGRKVQPEGPMQTKPNEGPCDDSTVQCICIASAPVASDAAPFVRLFRGLYLYDLRIWYRLQALDRSHKAWPSFPFDRKVSGFKAAPFPFGTIMSLPCMHVSQSASEGKGASFLTLV